MYLYILSWSGEAYLNTHIYTIYKRKTLFALDITQVNKPSIKLLLYGLIDMSTFTENDLSHVISGKNIMYIIFWQLVISKTINT